MKDQAAERPPLNMRDTVATRIHTRSGSSVLGLQESTPEGRPLIERAALVFHAPNPSLHFAFLTRPCLTLHEGIVLHVGSDVCLPRLW